MTWKTPQPSPRLTGVFLAICRGSSVSSAGSTAQLNKNWTWPRSSFLGSFFLPPSVYLQRYSFHRMPFLRFCFPCFKWEFRQAPGLFIHLGVVTHMLSAENLAHLRKLSIDSSRWRAHTFPARELRRAGGWRGGCGGLAKTASHSAGLFISGALVLIQTP